MKFSDELIQKVWEKAKIASNNDPDIYRKDEFRAWIKRDQFGITENEMSYGWSIDLIIPASEGGNDELSNLRPLQWKNHKAKNNGELDNVVTSEGVINKYEYCVES